MADLLCRTFGDEPGKRDLIPAGNHVGIPKDRELACENDFSAIHLTEAPCFSCDDIPEVRAEGIAPDA